MEEKKNKWTLGSALFAGFLGISVVVAAPIIGLALLGVKGLDALGVDVHSGKEVDPYDL